MSSQESFYWYDYETFGADPRRDRPAQFAGIRTDADLNPVGEPLSLFCKPAPDFLPVPEACLITGITPQQALREGVPEAQFIAAIHDEFSVPGTCVAGYNSVRFDDEVTRYALYRNFFDPYAREWRNGNSRWDLIDPLRLARALRPDGIEWPRDDTGRLSMRLELLTAANGIDHIGAHDAVADVRATIAMARLLRDKQPKLFRFLLENRGKRQAADLLGLGTMQPVVHASEKFSSEKHSIAVVVALAWHPRNPNGVVTYDLSDDPTALLSLDPDTLRERVFTPVAKLPAGAERLNLKTVHLNKCPVLAPMTVLRPQDVERLGLDLGRCEKHLDALKHAPDLAKKIRAILDTAPPSEGEPDPDTMLYDGGFFSDRDRTLMNRLHTLSPAELSQARPPFEDPRLPEMLFRYRARNYPETLSADEMARWEAFRLRRINEPGGGGSIVRADYEATLRELEARPNPTNRQREIVASLWEYLREIAP
ncbi:exodeoxyribonuclease I [Methylomagnum sp.]